ncbi:hypothetical protein [Acidithiobacillus ferrooxidans]|nr:hypothetical protein [Acidithiobacillus ferrooxidans]
MKHYCFVLEVNEERMLVAAGTSSHLDSCPLEHEFQIEQKRDVEKLHLAKETRFDMKEVAWVDIRDFEPVSNIQECPNLYYKLQRALRSAGHI